ncbi:MAG: gamma-glutamyl-gamma-aminobutyrate hydrolase family protein [Cellulosilyticaceae bacterium]
MKPIIGIPTHLMYVGSSPSGGKEISYCNEDFSLAIYRAGGMPLLLPILESKDDILNQLLLCDGLLLPGGDDINPLLYGEEPSPHLGEVYAKVDHYELMLTRFALSSNKPILGICRGCQLLNISLGGNVYQDISEYPTPYLKHAQSARRFEATHTITFDPNSLLGKLFNPTISVNSFHHQVIHTLGKDLIATAHAKDGIIEAIELPSKPFIVGVQWHPEIMVNGSDEMLPLFKQFIASCI